jgi:Tol biopolymer transport system component
MPDLREVFEMTVKQMGEPDLDSWREQENRQRKANRNKKLGAIAVAAALLIAGVVVGVRTLGTDEVQPGGSSDGSTLTPDGAEETLSIIDVGSGTATPFTAPAGASDFDFTLDGSMVAYVDVDANGNDQVFMMDADGSNARQLTRGEGDIRVEALPGTGTSGGRLAWSPDGSMIAYHRDKSRPASSPVENQLSGPEIFTVRVSDGVSTRVTDEPQAAVDPGGWAPDGGSIVFTTLDPTIPHYSALSLDLTTGQTRLIVPDGSTPKLSPDGAWIAFNSWLKPHIRLILANSDGSGRRVIARFDGDDGLQEWSPDSTKIAFVADIDENGFGTHVYDLATGETRFVTDGTIESWVDNDHILVS